MNLVAQWAYSTGRWAPKNYDPIKECAKELSRSAREEYYVDPQGREVRKLHCYSYTDETGQKRWRWVDIIDAKPHKIHLALSQRRSAAVMDVVQLAKDRDSYNDNNPYGAVIQMSFNFDEDLEEMSQPTEYPDSPTD